MSVYYKKKIYKILCSNSQFEKLLHHVHSLLAPPPALLFLSTRVQKINTSLSRQIYHFKVKISGHAV